MEKDLALLNIYLQWKTGEKKLKKKKKNKIVKKKNQNKIK